MICWKVDKNSPLPIYKQLVNLVRDSVASGQLRKGEVLPSQRQLAKLLGLSRATIVKAMEEMTDLLISRKGTKLSFPIFPQRASNGTSTSDGPAIVTATYKKAVVLTAKKLIFPAFVYLQNIRTATQT